MNSASYVKYINFCKRTASVWKTQKCLCLCVFSVPFLPPNIRLWDEFKVTYLMRWRMKTCVSVHLTVWAAIDSQETKKPSRQSFGCIHTKPTKIQHFLFIGSETTPWFVLFSNFSSTWSWVNFLGQATSHCSCQAHLSVIWHQHGYGKPHDSMSHSKPCVQHNSRSFSWNLPVLLPYPRFVIFLACVVYPNPLRASDIPLWLIADCLQPWFVAALL